MWINRILVPLGVVLVPRPPSVKMLREHANVAEHHPIGPTSKTVAWMRLVADQMERPKR